MAEIISKDLAAKIGMYWKQHFKLSWFPKGNSYKLVLGHSDSFIRVVQETLQY